jgi:hypothetical protein
MDLTHLQAVLRRRTPFEILDLALLFLRRFARGYALLALFTLLPLALLNPLILDAVGWPWWLGYLLWFLEIPLIHLPFILYTSELLFRANSDPLGALRKSIHSLPAMWGVWTRQRLVPTAFIHLHTLELRFLEGLKGKELRKRQAYFQRGEQNSITVLLLLGLLTLFVAVAIWVGQRSLISLLAGLAWGKPAPFSLPHHLLVPLQVLTAAVYWPVVDFFTYIDGRTRSEGWDLSLELRFGAAS